MKRLKRWLIPLISVLVLVIGVFLAREQLLRVAIAYRINRANVFTPPSPISGESRWDRLWHNTQFYWDFSKLRADRNRRVKGLDPVLRPLVHEIARREAAGQNMHYSTQIYREVRWRLNFTPDIEATRKRIADLQQSLSEPEKQNLATLQQPSDGSWGMGFTVWYLRLYYSIDHLKDPAVQPQYPLIFLEKIDSPEKLTGQLDSVLHNDFTKTGEFNREELDETFSATARLLFAGRSTGFASQPELQQALREFIESWQNPATGCWGQWMVDRHGRIWKMDDMGITFHVISDTHGQVSHLDLIAKRLLQLDSVDFPAGIRLNGHYENHLNWDAVKIFRTAWPYLDETSRQQVRAEISRMLKWSLTQSYQPDGSFKVSDLDETPSDAYRYGVWFLTDAGYFRREDRFWTNEEFPESQAVHDRIKSRLESIGLSDPGLREAYESLQAVK